MRKWVLLTAGLVCCSAWMCQDVPINQQKFLASHNSYKQLPEKGVIRFLNRIQSSLPDGLDPNEMDYGHVDIMTQLDSFGIRGLELDVYADPMGGAYYKRRLPFFIWGPRQRSGIEELKEPGIKILHIKDVDYQSSVPTWRSAMMLLRDWSTSHPDHGVVIINVEVKTESPGGSSSFLRKLGFKPAPDFDETALLELSKTTSEVLGNRVYAPIKMLRQERNLKESIEKNNWPSVQETKGQFIFIMEGLNAPLKEQVLELRDSLPFFYYGEESHPNVVFVLKNNCKGHEEEIQQCVKRGLMVRTRADAGTIESRRNDYTTWESALKSGAQIISTDYYQSDQRWSSYCVRWRE
jgi:Phosphoinositide phospholipase C, Ca2+-dependent